MEGTLTAFTTTITAESTRWDRAICCGSRSFVIDHVERFHRNRLNKTVQARPAHRGISRPVLANPPGLLLVADADFAQR
jgi:hypothetical protein